jgi:hypothetical protein
VTVIFLLGAGASRKAGVPLVHEFITEFRATLNTTDQRTVDELVNRLLPAAAGGVVDVELLLDALEKVQNLRSDPVAALVGRNTVDIADPDELERLSDSLKRYIRQRCSQDITPDNVRYLVPILDLARINGTLDIFSLNYDMCIEMVAEDQRMRYTDGFDLVWAPERLDESGTVEVPLLRLYKIHGSVVWYRRSDFRYVKIPLLPTGEPIRYFTHEPVLEMMLYPALTKAGAAGPYQELLHRFRSILSTATTLIVVGYSFRDEPIRTLIQEVATGNASLTVLLVAPDAEAIRNRVFSDPALAIRTIALDETTEGALRGGRLFNNVQELTAIASLRKQAESQKPQNLNSAKQIMQQVVVRYVNLGQLWHARALAEREELTNPLKATARQLHPLPRLDLCLDFANQNDSNPMWWRLACPLLYWWELAVANQAGSGFVNAAVPFSARMGFPDLSYETISPSEQEIAAIRRLLLARAENNVAPSESRTMFFEQLGRLVELPESMRRALVANQAHSPMEHARNLLRDYMALPGASEMAAGLSET